MKKYIYIIIVVFLFGLVSFKAGANNVIAYDDDDDGVDDDFEYVNKRNVSIEYDDEEQVYEIEAILRTGINRDEIEFYLANNSNGFSIETEYDRESGSGEFELSFKVSFVSIVEYNDTNRDGVYNDTDEFVQEVRLNNFQPTNYTTITLPTGNIIHYLIINTTDGIFTAHIYISDEFTIFNNTMINNTMLTPNQIKVDIEISNFTYNSTNSLLALNITLESEIEYEMEDETEDENRGYSENEEWLTTTKDGSTGFFSWAKTANVDGKIENVTMGNKTVDGNIQRIYVNYPNGTHIYHDPKLGIAGIFKPLGSKTDSGDSDNDLETSIFLTSFYIISVVLIIGASISATTIYYYNRKKYLNNEIGKKSKILRARDKSSGIILRESRNKENLLQIIEEENSSEKTSQLNKINLTAISESFFEDINRFHWDENEQEEFIKEMLALSPKERKTILDEMKETLD